jgi:hypothetical protein
VTLELACNKRDLALLNLAIDRKLRACDLVALKIGDIRTAQGVRERACIVQKKTGRPVQFELTEGTRLSATAYGHNFRDDDQWLVIRGKTTSIAKNLLEGGGPQPLVVSAADVKVLDRLSNSDRKV